MKHLDEWAAAFSALVMALSAFALVFALAEWVRL